MFSPMLLTETLTPFDDEAWCWQLKWDGLRCTAHKQNGRTRLWSRHGREMTAQFPEVAEALCAGVAADHAVVDCELVVLSGDGRPDFYGVMSRHGQGNAERIRRAALRQPATLMAFDVLQIDSRDTTGLTLRDRQPLLEHVVRPGPSLQLVETWPGTSGTAAAKAVAERDLEGIVAKRLDSIYRTAHRSQDWRKLKFWHTAELTLLALRREPFGVLVGEPGAPVAMVELGWRPADRQVLSGLLRDLRQREGDDGLMWLKPLVRGRVRYRVTPEGRIREPVWSGFVLEAIA